MSRAKKRILIADDDQQLVEVLSLRCQALDLEVIAAHDALTALNLVHTCAPDVLCLDVNMPPGGGLGVCEMLSEDEKNASIPVIILTGEGDSETIRRCHKMCAYYVEKGGDIWSRVEPLLFELLDIDTSQQDMPSTELATELEGACLGRQTDGEVVPPTSLDCTPHDPILDAVFAALGIDDGYLEQKESGTTSPAVPSSTEPANAEPSDTEQPWWVLHVDDDPEMRAVMKTRLEKHGISVVSAFDGTSGVRTALGRRASAIILDYEMPNGRGDYALSRLKDNPITKEIPVIILTGVRDQFLERRLLGMGAAAFFNKPPQFELLIQELLKQIDCSKQEPVTA